MNNGTDLLRLRQAIEASWRPDPAYLFADESGNPSLGQCYVTSRVIQYYFPSAEIVEGTVQTPKGIDKHFWNLFMVGQQELHLDLTWQQFPVNSKVINWVMRDRKSLNDSPATVDRFNKLLDRVKQDLKST